MLIYCLTDNKPGHKNQIEGLVLALGKLRDIDVTWLDNQSNTSTLAPCDVIICAGHKTHWLGLKLKWRFKAKLIVLMKPSLPRCLFDLCIIPRHDGIKDSQKVFTTIGALNTVNQATAAKSNQGLILIGGPSKHVTWNNLDIAQQLQQLKDNNPRINWTLTTSRRTPSDFLDLLRGMSLADDRLSIIPVEQTDKQWLMDHFNQSAHIWVSEESVSMVYEGLSSGAQVGLLKVPSNKANRVSQGLNALIGNGQLRYLDSPEKQPQNNQPLQEAARTAQFVHDWLKH